MNQPVLSVKSLNVSFKRSGGTHAVVHDLRAEVYGGKTLAIVGESGSGKSVSSLSILQLLNKQISACSGQIVFNGPNGSVDILGLDASSLNDLRGNGIAMIFQEPMAALNPVLKCGAQVAEMISTHQSGLSKQDINNRVLELFKEVELPRPEKMIDSYPHQLSGGQQQRVMIAMALANKPLLLIADEPTTALDPQVQDGIIVLLKKLQEKTGMAIIFISHDLDAVEKIADDIIVIQQGAVVEQGPANRVLKNPQHPYTKGLLNCKPGSDKKGLRLPTVKNFLADPEYRPVPNPPKKIGPETILEVKDVSVVYTSGGWFKPKNQVVAISDINIKLFKGETVGIIGPSGCGKTTIGRVIAGWIRPTYGEVLLDGATYISPDLKPGKDWSREVQLIFQDPFGSLNPKIRIGQAICEPMLVHGLVANKDQAREQAEWLLEKVGLQKEHFDRYPHEFSGGQRQRIVIARALAVKPRILICDESVAALDVSVQAQVLNLLNDLQREFNLSYLFISHDHNVIAYFCDRIIEMEVGKIKESPSALNEVINAPVFLPEEMTRPVPETVPEKSDETLSLPDTLLADQVSASLLELRLKQGHQKMEKLAEELHIPMVIALDEENLPEDHLTLQEPLTLSPVAEVSAEPEKTTVFISAEKEDSEPVLLAEANKNPVQANLEESAEITPERPDEVEIIEQNDESLVKENMAPPITQTGKQYRSLGDFIKSNKK